MRVLIMEAPVRLDVSLSLSFSRRFLELAIPEEFRLLEAVLEYSRRLCAEPDVRLTVILVEGGVGDRLSLPTQTHGTGVNSASFGHVVKI